MWNWLGLAHKYLFKYEHAPPALPTAVNVYTLCNITNELIGHPCRQLLLFPGSCDLEKITISSMCSFLIGKQPFGTGSSLSLFVCRLRQDAKISILISQCIRTIGNHIINYFPFPSMWRLPNIHIFVFLKRTYVNIVIGLSLIVLYPSRWWVEEERVKVSWFARVRTDYRVAPIYNVHIDMLRIQRNTLFWEAKFCFHSPLRKDLPWLMSFLFSDEFTVR